MGEIIITVENVTKKFSGVEVLKNVCLQVEKGTICGIIGRNGSGKTVLFKCICGLLQIDEGRILADKNQIGTIIEEPGFLKQYSGKRNLELLASMSGKEHRNIDELLNLVGLEHAGRKKVGKYSMGMRQRLGIAQSIMEYQSILILDEPMNGLDNQGVEEMRRLFLELKDQGTTILLASHNRDDIEILCDKVYEMDNGNIKLGHKG
ncbi:MAG: ATP-binding cassette domain-containing protein [Eubacteriales bacterium]|nr:ATP-binding cassette domain-containing protein [Eubacteriales bacterium]